MASREWSDVYKDYVRGLRPSHKDYTHLEALRAMKKDKQRLSALKNEIRNEILEHILGKDLQMTEGAGGENVELDLKSHYAKMERVAQLDRERLQRSRDDWSRKVQELKDKARAEGEKREDAQSGPEIAHTAEETERRKEKEEKQRESEKEERRRRLELEEYYRQEREREQKEKASRKKKALLLPHEVTTAAEMKSAEGHTIDSGRQEKQLEEAVQQEVVEIETEMEELEKQLAELTKQHDDDNNNDIEMSKDDGNDGGELEEQMHPKKKKEGHLGTKKKKQKKQQQQRGHTAEI